MDTLKALMNITPRLSDKNFFSVLAHKFLDVDITGFSRLEILKICMEYIRF